MIWSPWAWSSTPSSPLISPPGVAGNAGCFSGLGIDRGLNDCHCLFTDRDQKEKTREKERKRDKSFIFICKFLFFFFWRVYELWYLLQFIQVDEKEIRGWAVSCWCFGRRKEEVWQRLEIKCGKKEREREK